jgi:hypothetical protein
MTRRRKRSRSFVIAVATDSPSQPTLPETQRSGCHRPDGRSVRGLDYAFTNAGITEPPTEDFAREEAAFDRLEVVDPSEIRILGTNSYGHLLPPRA